MNFNDFKREIVTEIATLRYQYVDDKGFAQREFKPLIILCDNLSISISQSKSIHAIKTHVEASFVNPKNHHEYDLHASNIVSELLQDETAKLYQRLQIVLKTNE